MCHFVTAVLPKKVNVQRLEVIAEKYSRTLLPLRNPSIESQLKEEESYFLTTAGSCDCGTALGAARVEESMAQRRQHTSQAKEKKLRQSGWTEAKIARWKEQRSIQQSRPRRTQDSTDWVEFLKELLSLGETPMVGILLHWYSGSLESRIMLRSREIVEFSKITAALLGSLEEDILYEFRTDSEIRLKAKTRTTSS